MYERDENRLTISMLIHIIITLALLYDIIRAGRVNPSQPSVQEFPDEYYCFTVHNRKIQFKHQQNRLSFSNYARCIGM